MGSVWYLDSGASFHMTGDKELFSDLEKKDLQMHIEMGDDGRSKLEPFPLREIQVNHFC